MPGERRTRRSRRSHTLLPLHARTRPSHTFSCWYCDFKISAFNGFLFSLGNRHGRFLRVWFAIGVGFSLVALTVVTMILLQELVWAIRLCSGNAGQHNLSLGWLFGVSSWVRGFNISLMDAGIMIFSTLVSVIVHEFGHCIAAARPMVLNVPPLSPLSGYLSHGDIIMSLDGSDIHTPQEWVEKLTHLDTKMLNQSHYSGSSKISQIARGGKGYCVPDVWIEEKRGLESLRDETSCPDDLVAFMTIPCCTSSWQDEDGCDDKCGKTRTTHCFAPKDVVKFKKCGGWQMTQTNQSCHCLQDECCLTPVQNTGKVWVEVSFLRPHSPECLKYRINVTTMGSESFGSESATCLETFVFIGDVVSIASSIKLSAYRPRWASGTFGTHVPNFMEKVLVSMFHVSASLALLNSMPVFLLDGESILEISLNHITWLDHRIRHKGLRLLLSSGTLLFAIALLRTCFFIFVGYQ